MQPVGEEVDSNEYDMVKAEKHFHNYIHWLLKVTWLKLCVIVLWPLDFSSPFYSEVIRIEFQHGDE